MVMKIDMGWDIDNNKMDNKIICNKMENLIIASDRAVIKFDFKNIDFDSYNWQQNWKESHIPLIKFISIFKELNSVGKSTIDVRCIYGKYSNEYSVHHGLSNEEEFLEGVLKGELYLGESSIKTDRVKFEKEAALVR